MSRPNWQKSFRRVPDAILARVSNFPGDEVMVSCVKKVSASELGSGTYGHLGMSIQGDHPVFPNRFMPDPSFGTYSLRNIQGQEIVRRDLPMVTKTFSAETPNWGDWSNGSHEISWDRDVYQRDFIPPKELEISIELLTTEPGESPIFVCRFRVEEVLNKKTADFEASLFSNLNLLQENTGAADVFAADADANAYLKSISVYWEILPPGERSEMLTHILAKFREPTKELREKLLDRYRVLEKLGPVAYISGTSGFQRYFGAQFADNLVVFENLEYGNAIYVMFDNWEELSKLSRIELLKNRPGFGFERIVHRAGWKDALKKLIKPRLAAAQHDMVMH